MNASIASPDGLGLIIDCASEACSAALVERTLVQDHRHEIIGRGHAERLVPMIGELVAGHRAHWIAVGCGPGSFAGVRIGIAAARGLAVGWQVPVLGFSTLDLVAAGRATEIAAAGSALVVMEGGHGQWFVQRVAADLTPAGDFRSLLPDEAILMDDDLVIGNRAEPFVALRGRGEVHFSLPDARSFPSMRADALRPDPRPIYGRAPDAKPMVSV